MNDLIRHSLAEINKRFGCYRVEQRGEVSRIVRIGLEIDIPISPFLPDRILHRWLDVFALGAKEAESHIEEEAAWNANNLTEADRIKKGNVDDAR